MRERDPLIEHLESLTDQSVDNLRREADKRLYSKREEAQRQEPTCQTCGGTRLMPVRLRVNSQYRVPLGIVLKIDYGLGPGSGIELPANLCVDCGAIQGDWPLPPIPDETP